MGASENLKVMLKRLQERQRVTLQMQLGRRQVPRELLVILQLELMRKLVLWRRRQAI